MKTKEEILEHFIGHAFGFVDGHAKGVYSAMQEYAEQEMIEFAKWVCKDYLHIANGYFLCTKLDEIPPGEEIPQIQYYTSSFLLTKYKEECKSK